MIILRFTTGVFLLVMVKTVPQNGKGHTKNNQTDFGPVHIVILVAFKDDDRGDVKENSSYHGHEIRLQTPVEIGAKNHPERGSKGE